MINSTKLILVLIIACLYLQSGYAVEKEVIAEIGGRTITNIEIFENIALNGGNPLNDIMSDPYLYGGTMDSMLPIILFERYAAKNGIKITEQEIVDSLTKSAKQRGRTLAEDIQKIKSGFEDFENARKRCYKQTYDYFLDRKVVEHYNPDVNNVTEKDIQKLAVTVKPSTLQSEASLRQLIKQVSGLVNIQVSESTINEIINAVKGSKINPENVEQLVKMMSGKK